MGARHRLALMWLALALGVSGCMPPPKRQIVLPPTQQDYFDDAGCVDRVVFQKVCSDQFPDAESIGETASGMCTVNTKAKLLRSARNFNEGFNLMVEYEELKAHSAAIYAMQIMLNSSLPERPFPSCPQPIQRTPGLR